MKYILGLDLGTNSIGWALIQQDFENKQGEILGMGSRIIIVMGNKIKKPHRSGAKNSSAYSLIVNCKAKIIFKVKTNNYE